MGAYDGMYMKAMEVAGDKLEEGGDDVKSACPL